MDEPKPKVLATYMVFSQSPAEARDCAERFLAFLGTQFRSNGLIGGGPAYQSPNSNDFLRDLTHTTDLEHRRKLVFAAILLHRRTFERQP